MKKTVLISLLIGFLAAALLMGAVLNGWLDLPVISAPANPSAGFLRLFADTSTGKLGCKDSSGASCLAGGAASGWNAGLSSFTEETLTNYAVADVSNGGIEFHSTGGGAQGAGTIKYRSNAAFNAGNASVAVGFQLVGNVAGQSFILYLKDGSCTGTGPGYITFYFNFDVGTNAWGVGTWHNDCAGNWAGDGFTNRKTSFAGTGAFRIRESSGTRYYEISADPLGRAGWMILGSESTGAYITPTQTGFWSSVGSASGVSQAAVITTWSQP
jgi:hypothetical protein